MKQEGLGTSLGGCSWLDCMFTPHTAGVFMRDITFFNDGNEKFLKNGLINFSKLRTMVLKVGPTPSPHTQLLLVVHSTNLAVLV